MRHRRVAVLVALGAVLSGCGGDAGSETEKAPAATSLSEACEEARQYFEENPDEKDPNAAADALERIVSDGDDQAHATFDPLVSGFRALAKGKVAPFGIALNDMRRDCDFPPRFPK